MEKRFLKGRKYDNKRNFSWPLFEITRGEMQQNWKLNALVSHCESIIRINLLLCGISVAQSTICKSVVQNETDSFKIDDLYGTF